MIGSVNGINAASIVIATIRAIAVEIVIGSPNGSGGFSRGMRQALSHGPATLDDAKSNQGGLRHGAG